MRHTVTFKIVKPYIIPIVFSGVFLFFDQLFKYFARTYPDYTYYLWQPWLGWEYFPNYGIAFSLPFPNTLLIILTPIIILVLFFFLAKQKKPALFVILGISMIIAGAISNLIDRILFSSTTDYLRLFTGVINIADIIIVSGAGLLLLDEFWKKKAKKEVNNLE